MADHPLISAATAENGLVADTLLDAFVKRMPLTIGPTEDLVDTVQSIGSVPLSILSAATGQVYFYDETDSTTPDDGVTCLVDGLGRRYKVSDAASIEVSSILAISDTPPVSPSLGDAYVVDVAPTGAWAANAKDIAIYTQRGWVFATPQVGTTVLNEDTGRNTQYSSAGAWGEFPTSTVIATDITIPNTGLHILDTDASHDLIVRPGSNLSADRTLTITTGDTNVEIDLTDPGADRLLFWDDSASKWIPLTLGTNLAITGTTLDATGGGQPIPTSSTFAVGTLLLCRYTSTTACADGATTSGSNLSSFAWQNGGGGTPNFLQTGMTTTPTLTGTWMNVSGRSMDADGASTHFEGYFVRTA